MEETKALIPNNSKNLIKEALSFLDSIESIVIQGEPQYHYAVKSCKEIKRLAKLLESEKKTLTEPFYRPYKEIMAEFKSPIESLTAGEGKFKRAMSTYKQEEQRKQIALQRKLNAESAETRRKAEEKAHEESEKAKSYLMEGKDELTEKASMRAENAMEKATETVAPVVEDKTKAQGLSYRTDYKCIEEDKKAAILFMAENPMMIFNIAIDLKKLEKIAKIQKGHLGIPGIRVVPHQVAIVRT